MQEKNIYEKTLVGHIGDLKGLIMHCSAIFVALFLICWYFSDDILLFMVHYFVPQGYNLNYFTLESIFFTNIRIAFFSGIICFIPVVLPRIFVYFRCVFINQSVGVLSVYCGAACVLFICGVLLGVFFVVPKFIIFMLNMASSMIDVRLNVSSFISTAMIVILVAGLLFQVPLLFFVLLKTGIVTPEIMKKYRKAYVILSFIVAAIVTPPDVFSQIIVALFLIGVFEVMFLISRFLKQKDA